MAGGQGGDVLPKDTEGRERPDYGSCERCGGPLNQSCVCDEPYLFCPGCGWTSK